MLRGKAQRAMHATGLVPVHSASDQHRGQRTAPTVAAQGHEWEALFAVHGIRIDDFAVAFNVPLCTQLLHRRKHVVGIAALAHLAGAPLLNFGGAPGLAGGAERIETGDSHECSFFA